MKNSQQHLGNEANVTLRKNINLGPRLFSHFHAMLYFWWCHLYQKDFWCLLICNLQSAVCSLQSSVCSLQFAVCGLQSAVCCLQSAACKCHTPVPGQLTSSLYYLHSPSKSSVLDSFSTIKHSNFQIILAHHEVFGLMAGVQRPDPVFVSHSAQLCLHLKNKTVALRVKRSTTEDW